MSGEKIFAQYGFDNEISTKDTFNLTALGGILFLHLIKENGDSITSRRKVIDEEGTTESFDVNKLSKQDKEDLVHKFLKLETSQSEITRFLGLSPSYISNLKRTK